MIDRNVAKEHQWNLIFHENPIFTEDRRFYSLVLLRASVGVKWEWI